VSARGYSWGQRPYSSWLLLAHLEERRSNSGPWWEAMAATRSWARRQTSRCRWSGETNPPRGRSGHLRGWSVPGKARG